MIGCHPPLRRAILATALLIGGVDQYRNTVAAQASLCTIETSGIEFGIYDTRRATPLDATGGVTFSCTSSLVVTIVFTPGVSGSFERAMSGGADQLFYNLFLDPFHTQVWGDGTSGTAVYINTNPPKDASIGIPVYGQIPARQSVAEGRYTDSLMVVLVF